MRILVLGAGAIGGYFGGRLAESGADVTFLVRPRRGAQLTAEGLRVTSELGDLRLPVQTVTAEELTPQFDVVILTCKAYDLDEAMDAIAPAVTGSCTVLPLLNGLAHLERLDARFGADRVLGGTCMIDARLLADGTIQHGGTLQRVVFGERDCSRSERVEALARVLQPSRIDCEIAEDIIQRMWDKLAFLAALAATTCLFRANVGDIISAPGGREAMERTLAANVEIARREGHAPSDAAIAFARKRLTDPAGTWSASLMRDLEAGGKTEGDHIVGWMLRRARAHGVDDTMLSLAWTTLNAYEARRDGGRLAPVR